MYNKLGVDVQMRYTMLIENRVIQIVNADTTPNWPPDPQGNAVTAQACEDETVKVGMYYDSETGTYYTREEPESEPTEQDIFQAQTLLNQAEIINKQTDMDETLAAILLNQTEV